VLVKRDPWGLVLRKGEPSWQTRKKLGEGAFEEKDLGSDAMVPSQGKRVTDWSKRGDYGLGEFASRNKREHQNSLGRGPWGKWKRNGQDKI